MILPFSDMDAINQIIQVLVFDLLDMQIQIEFIIVDLRIEPLQLGQTLRQTLYIFIIYLFKEIKLELGCIAQMRKSMIACSAKILEQKLLCGIIPHTISTALISA